MVAAPGRGRSEGIDMADSTELLNDQHLRATFAEAVQRAQGNVWLAADYVLLGPVAALLDRARQEERQSAAIDAREWCRRCRDLDQPMQRAVVILWGKLLPPEHLGPRCYDHAAEAIGWQSMHPEQFAQHAGFDLRPFIAREDPADRSHSD